jgi:hypothetical protein
MPPFEAAVFGDDVDPRKGFNKQVIWPGTRGRTTSIAMMPYRKITRAHEGIKGYADVSATLGALRVDPAPVPGAPRRSVGQV